MKETWIPNLENKPKLGLFCSTHGLVIYEGVDRGKVPAISQSRVVIDYTQVRHQIEFPECREFEIKLVE